MPYASVSSGDGRALHAAGKSARGIAAGAMAGSSQNKNVVTYQSLEWTEGAPQHGTKVPGPKEVIIGVGALAAVESLRKIKLGQMVAGENGDKRVHPPWRCTDAEKSRLESRPGCHKCALPAQTGSDTSRLPLEPLT
jgi:hypothetical protein